MRQKIFWKTEHDQTSLFYRLKNILITCRMSFKTQKEKELEKKAVEEIMKETNRAAARAEVGGSLSWRKPKNKGINKRFLNNTMLSTVIQNKKSQKQTLPIASLLPHHITTPADKSMMSEPEVTKQPPDSPQAPKITNKVIISSKGRFKAYLASYRKQKVDNEKIKGMDEAKDETEDHNNQNT